MKYGLIICPSCGKARGVETSKKTATCPCGRTGRLFKSQVKYETDSPLELADMVAQANSQLANGKRFRKPRAKEAKDPHGRVAQRAKSLRNSVEVAEAVARGLTEEFGEFSADDFGRVMSLLGKGPSEEVLKRLVESNALFEVAEGRYRVV